jgi:hypothetical protein
LSRSLFAESAKIIKQRLAEWQLAERGRAVHLGASSAPSLAPAGHGGRGVLAVGEEGRERGEGRDVGRVQGSGLRGQWDSLEKIKMRGENKDAREVRGPAGKII